MGYDTNKNGTIKVNTKNFNFLVQTLNHNVSKLGTKVGYIEKVIYYMATLSTLVAGKLILF